jgi:hypothetical protein
MGEAAQEDGWVVCRIFKKKNLNKTLDRAMSSSPITADTRNQTLSSCNEGSLDQMLHYMGSTCKEENIIVLDIFGLLTQQSTMSTMIIDSWNFQA